MMEQLLRLLADGLEIIGKLTKNRDVEDAPRILDAIQQVWETMHNATQAQVSLDAARKELLRLRKEIADNDAAADTALDDKFPTEE